MPELTGNSTLSDTDKEQRKTASRLKKTDPEFAGRKKFMRRNYKHAPLEREREKTH